jgi:predicted nucleotidyltransferase component of viral defense system
LRLHENKVLFEESIRATALHFNLREIFVRKDYWLSKALKEIFMYPCPRNVNFVFKGGTSLSKIYRIIKRFSEDVDLGVEIKEELSGNKIKNIIKIPSEVTSKFLPEDPDKDHKKGSCFRKTYHSFPLGDLSFENIDGQLKEHILLEVNSFTDPIPFNIFKTSCYVEEFLLERKEKSLIKEYNLEKFSINVLCLERTFFEKIFALVNISFEENSIEVFKVKVRHFYDVHLLMKNQEIINFLSDPKKVVEMFVKVKSDEFVTNNSGRLSSILELISTPLFENLDSIFLEIKIVYNRSFKELLYGELPDLNQVKESFIQLKNQLSGLSDES